jgi:hypothetical protein
VARQTTAYKCASIRSTAPPQWRRDQHLPRRGIPAVAIVAGMRSRLPVALATSRAILGTSPQGSRCCPQMAAPLTPHVHEARRRREHDAHARTTCRTGSLLDAGTLVCFLEFHHIAASKSKVQTPMTPLWPEAQRCSALSPWVSPAVFRFDVRGGGRTPLHNGVELRPFILLPNIAASKASAGGAPVAQNRGLREFSAARRTCRTGVTHGM